MEILNKRQLIPIKFTNDTYNLEELMKKYPESVVKEIRDRLIEEVMKEINSYATNYSK